MADVGQGEAGLVRFARAERLVHRAVAVLMLTSIGTAAVLYNGFLAVPVGHRRLVKLIHVWAGFALPLPVLAGVLSSAYRADLGRLNRFAPDDWRWLRLRARRDGTIRVGKFNAGQKLNARLGPPTPRGLGRRGRQRRGCPLLGRSRRSGSTNTTSRRRRTFASTPPPQPTAAQRPGELGVMALELARARVARRAANGFHPGFVAVEPTESTAITARVLMICGADDPVVSVADRALLDHEMRTAGVADWRLEIYGGVGHCFTNP